MKKKKKILKKNLKKKNNIINVFFWLVRNCFNAVVIIVIVVGPKEIPNLLKQLGSFSKSLKKASRQFKNSLNDLAEEGDLKDIKKSMNLDISNIKKDLDPKNVI